MMRNPFEPFNEWLRRRRQLRNPEQRRQHAQDLLYDTLVVRIRDDVPHGSLWQTGPPVRREPTCHCDLCEVSRAWGVMHPDHVALVEENQRAKDLARELLPPKVMAEVEAGGPATLRAGMHIWQIRMDGTVRTAFADPRVEREVFGPNYAQDHHHWRMRGLYPQAAPYFAPWDRLLMTYLFIKHDPNTADRMACG
jgi:hypothetical protein